MLFGMNAEKKAEVLRKIDQIEKAAEEVLAGAQQAHDEELRLRVQGGRAASMSRRKKPVPVAVTVDVVAAGAAVAAMKSSEQSSLKTTVKWIATYIGLPLLAGVGAGLGIHYLRTKSKK